MKDLSRRQFVKLGATATGAAALAGLSACSGDGGVASPAASTSSDGTIELTYWYCWTDKIKENNEERIQEFNDTIGKEKGIHVTAAPTMTSTPSSRALSSLARRLTSASWSSTRPRSSPTAA